MPRPGGDGRVSFSIPDDGVEPAIMKLQSLLAAEAEAQEAEASRIRNVWRRMSFKHDAPQGSAQKPEVEDFRDSTAAPLEQTELFRPYSVDPWAELKILNAPPAAPECKALGGKAVCVAVGSTVELRSNTKQKQCLHVLRGHSGTVTCLDATAHSFIFSGSQDGGIIKWDPRSGEIVARIDGHAKVITCLLVLENLGILLSSSGDGKIKAWRLDDCENVLTISAHRLMVITMAFNEAAGTLYSGSADKTIKKWDVKSGTHLATLQGHKMPVIGLEIAPSLGVLFSAEWRYTLFIRWDLSTDELLETRSMEEVQKTVVAW